MEFVTVEYVPFKCELFTVPTVRVDGIFMFVIVALGASTAVVACRLGAVIVFPELIFSDAVTVAPLMAPLVVNEAAVVDPITTKLV
jgi:hypothetical protein